MELQYIIHKCTSRNSFGIVQRALIFYSNHRGLIKMVDNFETILKQF